MSEFVNNFIETSSKLTDYVRRQLEKAGLWTNLPGGLARIASSPSGYVWGYNSDNTVFSCKEPCTGGWAPYGVIPGDVVRYVDIQCDNLYVYVLVIGSSTQPAGDYSNNRIAIRPVDGSGAWRFVRTPSKDAARQTSLAVSDSFLLVSGNGCAKPCATETWVPIPMDDSVSLLHASTNHTYETVYDSAKNAINKRSDASAQAGWEELSGLKQVVPSAVESDNTAIYGTKSGRPVRCVPPYKDEESCKPLDTGGREPTSMSVNPTSKTLYMTTVEPGPAGNIFQRLDTDNGQDVVAHADMVGRQLDRDVNSLGGEIRIHDAQIMARDAMQEASQVIGEATNLEGPLENTMQETQKLRSEIRNMTQTASGYAIGLLPLQILAGTLAVLLAVFLLAGLVLPASVTIGLGVLILASGFGAAIYFVVNKQE
jgi:hypothetical protein